ncbi:hypothetical protein ACHAW6_015849 [Cyclotella cf. meneghiniana]
MTMTSVFISSNTLLAVFLLSTSSTTSSAFVHHFSRSSPRVQPLHATETFQRSLLEARLKLSDRSKSSPAENDANDAASSSSSSVATPIASVDYDAAARLAYEAAGSNGEFAEFRVNYLEETSALMAKKNPYVKTEADTPLPVAPEEVDATPKIASVDYDAAARLAYIASGQTGDFHAFKTKYLQETSDMVATKNPYVAAPTIPIETSEPPPEASAPLPSPVPEPVLLPAPAPAPLPKTEFTIPRELAIVPINEATVQFTAGLLGAAAGFLLGGPVLSAVLAGAANYLSRKDDEEPSRGSGADASPKKIVDAASRTALLLYNFLARFERENDVVDSALRILEGGVDRLKSGESPASEAVVRLEETLGGVVKKVEEWNDDYDFVNGAGTVLNSVGDLVEVSVDKVVELNEEYRLTERVGGVIKETVKKVTEEKRD